MIEGEGKRSVDYDSFSSTVIRFLSNSLMAKRSLRPKACHHNEWKKNVRGREMAVSRYRKEKEESAIPKGIWSLTFSFLLCGSWPRSSILDDGQYKEKEMPSSRERSLRSCRHYISFNPSGNYGYKHDIVHNLVMPASLDYWFLSWHMNTRLVMSLVKPCFLLMDWREMDSLRTSFSFISN